MLVTYKGFKIDLPYDILQIEYMSLEENINDHICLNLRILIEEDKVFEYINEESSNKKIVVYEYNRHIQREVPIFQGKIKNVKINYQDNLHFLELSCISFTHDFDIKKVSRTFCDLELTYNQVIKDILSAYPKKDFQDMATNNTKINDFLLQYEETDWQFIKRLATHFEALLLPDAAASFGRIYFGLPKINNNVEISENDYSIIKNIQNYKEYKSRSKTPLMLQDYTSWEIVTNIRLYLGEEVVFNNVQCQVTKVYIYTYKEEIRYAYNLQISSGVKSIYTVNPKIYGMSIPAIIKERKGNSVRVHFEVDNTYIKKPNNKFFAYALESSSWYCMPVEGSKVHIYFPTNDEKEAIAVHSIRSASGQAKYADKISNPNHKSFSNTTGSEMKMTENDIIFAADDAKNISLKLQKSGNIDVSGKNITFSAKSIELGVRNPPPNSDVEPLRPKSIKISAKESFMITRNDFNNSINLEEETHLMGTFIKINATDKNPPMILASEYDQSAQDAQLIAEYNAGAKKELEDKLNAGKSKIGFGAMAMAIGGAAIFAAATVLTGGLAIGIAAAGIAAVGVGASETSEGMQDYTKAQSGDFSESYNFMRDTVCGGRKDIYNIVKYGSVIISGLGVAAAGGACMVVDSLLDTGINTAVEMGMDYMDDGKINNGIEYYVKNASTNIAMVSFGGATSKKFGFDKMTKGKKWAAQTALDTGLGMVGDVSATGDTSIWDNLISSGVSNKITNSIFSGDPVNVSTGSLYIPATDLVLPDINSEFKIERKYNSVNNRVGILGKGWTFNYESKLHLEKERAILLCTDGHIEIFYKNDDIWENSKGKSNLYTLNFDINKNIYNIIDNHNKLKYLYNEDGQLIKIIDKNKNEIVIKYEGSSIKTLKTFSNYILNFIYKDGKIVEIKDELGRTVQYKYEGDYLTHVVHVDYGITKYDYDKQGYVSAITDQNGNTYTVNEFDNKGRVTYQEYSTEDTCTITYDDANRETSFYFSESKRLEKYKYDQNYLITHIYYEDGTYEEYGYDSYQNKVFEKDRNGHITRTEYNIYGNKVKQELPNALIVNYEYDEKQNLIKKSDNNEGETLYTYNTNGNIIEEKNKINTGLWQTIKYEYDSYSRVVKTTDPLGNIKNFEYENGERVLPQPSSIKDSENNIYEYTYDKVGRNTSIITEYGEVEFGYNRLNYITYIKDPNGSITRKYYDKMGNLTRLVTPNNYNPKFDNGQAYEYKYDSMDKLIQIKDPLGNTIKNKRDTEGNIIKEINPNYYDFLKDDGIGIVYEYDKGNRKIKTIYPDGGVERLFYDSQGNIIKHITPEYYNSDTDDGLGYTYEYDSMNRLTTIIDPSGEIEKKYEYDLYGNISCEIDKEENTTLFKYDLLGNILEKREPVDKIDEEVKYKITVYEYDKNSNKIKEKHGKDPVNQKDYPLYYHEIHFTYDKNNRLTGVNDKYGAKLEYKYDCLNNKIYEKFRINDNANKIIHYKYDNTGKLIEKKEEIDGEHLLGAVKGKTVFAITKYSYDKNGNITNITTPKGHTINRVYDEIDRLTQENQTDKTNNIQRKYEYQYDKTSNIIKTINNTNNITKEYIYDSKNRLTHYINELKNTTRLFYDKNDRIIKEVLPQQYNEKIDDGEGTTYKYNIKGQLLETKNPLGQTIEKNEYDYKGNKISVVDGVNNKVEYTYNLLGNIKQIITPNSKKQNKEIQKYTYDIRGNITGICDGNGNNTKYELDDWGRIIQIVTAEGTVEKYTYDYAGNITSTTDANENTITYEYNNFNKVSKIKDQEGYSEYFYYDEEGNQVEHIDRNENKVLYGYNIDNNITFRKGYNKNNQKGIYEEFKYNLDGTLNLAKANNTTYTYKYTKDGRLKSKHASGKTLLEYRYDKNGNTKTISDITGKSTHYIYDPANRVKEILDSKSNTLAQYTYNPNDSIKSILYGNGISTNYTYDEEQNISSLITKTSKGETLVDYNYKHDLNGNTLEKVGTKHQTYYTYDSLNRLTSAKYDNKKERFTYDNVGNRLTKTTDTGIAKYTYNVKNQLITLAATQELTNFYYDKQGNTIKEETPQGSNIYEYNTFNQQTKAITKEGNTLISRYDALGLRTEIEENEKLTKFIFHKQNILVELDEQDNQISRFARGYEIISSDIKDNTYYYQQDEQGSTLYITDNNENVQNHYHYDVFGVILESEENISNRITYTGQQYDSITQQYYLRARYYNPIIGRFTQEDVYRGDGLNLYAYCSNNPVVYYDPSGYKCSINKERASANRNTNVTSKDDFIEVYHGTNYKGAKSIKKSGIDISTYRSTTDFGKGFYVTRKKNQAIKWVKRKFRGNGEVLVFKVPKLEFNELNGKVFDSANIDWEEFIKHNRLGGELHKYDFVEGPMLANPTTFIDDGKLESFGNQISVHTDKAIELLNKSLQNK
ncbi:RHS repeat-associated core domain-containing protein [Tepidibacter mesophilus]|uniref:RHS repeat-associated core domain-containing protein n=1 Tax=Tepidibacter mesophilus TaxID=655607 RepID=UPI000C07DE76|nr:RHS repeat-associated core domain-containing protein [Tepidibacter mesophilus]